MTIDEKIIEYKDQFIALRDLSPHGYEIYRWMIALGKKLQEDPLSKEKRTEENKVSRCLLRICYEFSNRIFSLSFSIISYDSRGCLGAP